MDVVKDPVAINDCEHIFCRACIGSDKLVKCPTCQVPFKVPKWNEIKGFPKRCYLGLEVKCLNPSCDTLLDVDTFEDHDLNCPVTFELCPDCGLKSRRGSNDVHSCGKVLAEHYAAKMVEFEEELDKKFEKQLDEIKKLFKTELDQVRIELQSINQLYGYLNSSVNSLKAMPNTGYYR